MRLLVAHQNFPGQFGHLVGAWARRPGWQVIGLGSQTAPGLPGFGGLVRYKLARRGRDEQHPYLRQMESATLHGQASARAMLELRKKGFTPDVILAHPGWGETLYAKDVFPNARLVHFCEWYYGADGADMGFDPEFPISFDDRARIRTWNALHTLNLEHCDAAISPTKWQRSRHPEIYQPKIRVLHEGVRTDILAPDLSAAVAMPNGALLKAGDPVITYVARNLEPYRGFHVFMRALERIQRIHSGAHAVIVGGDGVSYGRRPQGAANWREKMLDEVKLDPTRTHFLGKVPHEQYVRLLQISGVHVYLTYPFVLSWSMLEAMACGALIVGSNTAPVREVIRNGENGRLVEFFDPEQIARSSVEALEDRAGGTQLRERARQDAKIQYGQGQAVTGYDSLLAVGGTGSVYQAMDRLVTQQRASANSLSWRTVGTVATLEGQRLKEIDA